MQNLANLNPKEKTTMGCDIKAASIILQGLPNDIYTLLNHKTKACDIWYRVKELMGGTELTKQERESKLADEFDRFMSISSLSTIFSRNGVGRHTQSYAGNTVRGNATGTTGVVKIIGDLNANPLKVIRCYNCRVSLNDTNVESPNDTNVIFDISYANINKNEVVQDMTSLAQTDAIILLVIENIQHEATRCNTVKRETKQVNESFTIEFERYKENVKKFETQKEPQLVFTSKEHDLDSQIRKQIVDHNEKVDAFIREFFALTQELSLKVETKFIPENNLDVLKKGSSEKEDKYIDEVFVLNKKKTELENIAKDQLHTFDELVKLKTTINVLYWGDFGVHHVKRAYESDVKPLVTKLRESLTQFEQEFHKEVLKMKEIFEGMETKVDQCSVEKKYFEIEKKELLIKSDRLLEECLSKDLMCIIVQSFDNLDEYSEMPNFTYIVDFMIIKDISSIIDPRLSQVVLGKPFVEISNMTHDPQEGIVRFTNGNDEVAYKMPHKIEQYNSLSNLEKEHTKSVYLRNEEHKRRGVQYVMSKILGFYKECLELRPEYLTGMEDEGEVT
ncbi:hypothetical protein Tco_0727663 [Tanacetum coccineum]|uniref:Uncharacterized protein n=1 Tax=Tanacetum coccineum TaxID=301880 RepID=A0ABQ4YLG3_9ASTR